MNLEGGGWVGQERRGSHWDHFVEASCHTFHSGLLLTCLLSKWFTWVLCDNWTKEGLVRAGWILTQEVIAPRWEVFITAYFAVFICIQNLQEFQLALEKSINDYALYFLLTNLEHALSFSATHSPGFLQITVLRNGDESSAFNLNSLEKGPTELVDGMTELTINHRSKVVDEVLLHYLSEVITCKRKTSDTRG